VNIDALFMEYAAHFLARTQPKAWDIIVQLEAKLNDKTIPRHMTGREKRVVAIEQYLSQVRVYDPVLDGLRSAVRYDRSYFDKIVASLLPLLERLTSGKIAQLLARREALNKSQRRMHLRIRAACCVANARDSYGYRCALRLAFHPDPQRLL